jgi:hypothetical protein
VTEELRIQLKATMSIAAGDKIAVASCVDQHSSC